MNRGNITISAGRAFESPWCSRSLRMPSRSSSSPYSSGERNRPLMMYWISVLEPC